MERGIKRIAGVQKDGGVQQDGVGRKERETKRIAKGTNRKRDQEDRGDRKDGGEKERETIRIAKGAKRMEDISR